ncbi:hypothetical protein [Helicobacter pylori]|uniref:hypothetical protein n=1 Tax=Helicobacter pylori TaxID=210 RepID=UPI0013CDEC43|nr:hypothetical protein [Helicobacter pylori]
MKPKLSHQPRENLKYLSVASAPISLFSINFNFLKNGIFKTHKEIGGILKSLSYNLQN